MTQKAALRQNSKRSFRRRQINQKRPSKKHFKASILQIQK
jgi:hypothetical protein